MARRRSPDSTNDRQRIQFAFNADRDTPVGQVFEYLLKNDKLPSRKGKHKGLDAMTAFWQPFACQANEQLSKEEKKAIAKDAIEALSRQIDLIRDAFDIEDHQATSDISELKQQMRTVVTEVVNDVLGSNAVVKPTVANVSISPQASHSASSEKTDSEGVDFDEDALLGGLFDSSEIAA